MIVVDSNALVVLLVGLVDPKQISQHSRTSIYDEADFQDLLTLIDRYENILAIPNIWAEVDNLLNDFNGGHKDNYVAHIINLIQKSSERYLASTSVSLDYHFHPLGLTDTLILQLSKEAEFLITADSKLSDYAKSLGIQVYDLVEEKNKKILR